MRLPNDQEMPILAYYPYQVHPYECDLSCG